MREARGDKEAGGAALVLARLPHAGAAPGIGQSLSRSILISRSFLRRSAWQPASVLSTSSFACGTLAMAAAIEKRSAPRSTEPCRDGEPAGECGNPGTMTPSGDPSSGEAGCPGRGADMGSSTTIPPPGDPPGPTPPGTDAPAPTPNPWSWS